MIELARTIAQTHYNLQAGIHPLPGYEDHNFRVTTSDGRQFILKLTTNPRSRPFLEAQNQVLLHLSSEKEYFPTVVPSTNGKDILTITDADGNVYFARLLTYLEGTFLAKARHTPALFHAFGRVLGNMNKALEGLWFPAINERRALWDLAYFPDIAPYISFIRGTYRQTLVRYFLLQHESLVAPLLRQVRKSIIHGDANDWNILVKADNISGIIDFGDMCYTATISELAIALVYCIAEKEDPLARAGEIIRGYHEVFPLREEELKILYYLIAARLCTSVTMSTYSRAQNPENAYISISEEKMWSLLEVWIEINPIRAENAFRAACGFPSLPAADLDVLVQQRHQYISGGMSISYDEPIKMQGAALQYMYDDRGNTYLDCVNNICHVGHCHPRVVKAGMQQMARLNTNTRYLYDSLNEYAEKLCATFPSSLNKVFFVNSGSAATDLALRLARTYTQRREVITVAHGYHGCTTAAIQVSPYKYESKGGQGQEAGIHQVSMPDTFRGKYRKEDPLAGKKFAEEVKATVAAAERAGSPIAAFICESIIGCGGQVMLPEGYLPAVYKSVREGGGLCIADEVQVGFGRVGSHFWGFELQRVIPDIVILGKPIGNGHPMGAVVTTTPIAEAFDNGMEFFSSFGGNPVSCVIGKMVLEVIQSEGLQENARETGTYLIEKLRVLQDKYPEIGDVRGAGLFLGIELVKDRDTLEPAPGLATEMVNTMKERGILLSTDGPFHNVIKFKPPLVFSKKNADRLLGALEGFLATRSPF